MADTERAATAALGPLTRVPGSIFVNSPVKKQISIRMHVFSRVITSPSFHRFIGASELVSMMAEAVRQAGSQ